MDQFTFKRPQDDFSLQVPLSVIKSRLITCFVNPFSLGFTYLVKLVVVLSMVMVAACDTAPTTTGTEIGQGPREEVKPPTPRPVVERPSVQDTDATAENIIGLVNRCADLNELQRYEEALQSCDKAIELIPKFVARNGNSVTKANRWRAVALNSRGAIFSNGLKLYKEALESLNEATTIDPKYAEAWYNQGNILRDLKRYPEALESYDKAIAINPNFAEAWVNRGSVLNDLKRYPEALESFDKAIAINPKDAKAWYNRGNALTGLKDYKEAIKSYDEAITINPKFAEAWNNRGSALAEGLKCYQEAVDSYDKAIAIKPDYADALNNRKTALKLLKSDKGSPKKSEQSKCSKYTTRN